MDRGGPENPAVARIPEEKLTALLTIIIEMKARNVLSIKEVRSSAGKSTNISAVLYMWRLFFL